MITVQSIIEQIKSVLDAENSQSNDYYNFDLDFKPAINSAIDTCVSEINSFYGGKKFSENALGEISHTKIFYTNRYSRINLPAPSMTTKIWSLLAVLPLPDCGKIVNNVFIDLTNASITPANPAESDVAEHPNSNFLNTGAFFIKSKHPAKRLTAEEWEINRRNPFEYGHILETGETVNFYAWLNLNNYSNLGYTLSGTIKTEIEIRPELVNKFVGIRYVKYPSRVALISDNIEFPDWMEQIILNFALGHIAIKQGDNSTVLQTSKNNLKELLNSIV